MRKHVTNGDGLAKVLPFARAAGVAPNSRLEMGIQPAGDGIFLETTGRYRMTADQAEAIAVDLMGFVHELRNGGKLF